MIKVLLITIVKCIGIYILAIFLTRQMGTKIISQMSSFDFIMGVSMGSIIANAIVDKKFQAITAITALITFSILTIITRYLSIKSFVIRKLINSQPVTLVEKGKIVDQNMKSIKFTINELMMKLREKDIFSLADVEYAIMETDGQLSVLPKANKKPVTPYDMKISTASSGLQRDIIVDGIIIEENLKSAGLNIEWLRCELKKQNIKENSEVFYAGIDSNKKLHISKRTANNKKVSKKYGIE